MNGENCTKCAYSDPDNRYICSIGHSQTTTTFDCQVLKISYHACELACPDFKLLKGDDE